MKLIKKKNQAKTAETALAAFVNESTEDQGPKTEEEFLDHAAAMMEPVVDYIRRLYVDEDAPLFKTSQVVLAARVFDPEHVKNLPDATVKLLLNSLFENATMPTLSEDLLAKMMREVPQLRKMIISVPLDQVEGSSVYDLALQKRKDKLISADGAQTAAHPALTSRDPSIPSTWRDDKVETARRVWEFWRANGLAKSCPSWVKAARIVVLIQLSTGYVECLFSQAALIEEA